MNLQEVERLLDGSSKATDEQSTEWSDPKPIEAALPEVPPFKERVQLPKVLRDWVMDSAERMPCPPDFIASTAVACLGSIIGARCAIKPKAHDDWLIIPNLWGAVVGDPSRLKTPAINAGTLPVDRLIALAFEDYQKELKEFEAKNLVFTARKEAIEAEIKAAAKGKGEKKQGFGSTGSTSLDDLAKKFQAHQDETPKEPTQRRYKTNDPTLEKLGELLRDNPRGLLVLRDELVGLLASWDREGREGERAFFLEGWNGNGSFETDRIGRGSIFIPNLCVSIFGGIQPNKLTVYLEQAAHSLANDRMLQRLQVLVYPDQPKWEWRDRTPNKDARDQIYKIFETLANFDPVGGALNQPTILTSSPIFPSIARRRKSLFNGQRNSTRPGFRLRKIRSLRST